MFTNFVYSNCVLCPNCVQLIVVRIVFKFGWVFKCVHLFKLCSHLLIWDVDKFHLSDFVRVVCFQILFVQNVYAKNHLNWVCLGCVSNLFNWVWSDGVCNRSGCIVFGQFVFKIIQVVFRFVCVWSGCV